MSAERVSETSTPVSDAVERPAPALPAAPSLVLNVLRLQRTAGNAAVARLLARKPLGATAPPPGPASAPVAWDWTSVPEADRMAYVMRLLVETYGYPENGAAGLVGNLYEESGLIPNRVEGSSAAQPMRARDPKGKLRDFSADEIMNRKGGKTGPAKPGIGLAQWTTPERRAGLFAKGSDILYDMEGQVAYLVDELKRSYAGVEKTLRASGVTVDAASDDVVYRFEIPGSVLRKETVLDAAGNPVKDEKGKVKTKTYKRDRTDPQVVKVFERRRKSGHRALKAYKAAKAAAAPPPVSGPEPPEPMSVAP